MATHDITDEMAGLIDAATIALGDAGYEFQHADWHDVWGTAMAYAISLNDLIADYGGETNPTYRQAMGGSETDAYEYQAILEANLSLDQLEAAERILDQLLDVARAAGRDY